MKFWIMKIMKYVYILLKYIHNIF